MKALRWTEEHLAAFDAQRNEIKQIMSAARFPNDPPLARPLPADRDAAQNKLERRYQREVLDPERAAGSVLEYVYEGITLRFADRTRYTPDYFVVRPECIELIECKAFWQKSGKVGWLEDSRLKWKLAARLFPWFRVAAVWPDPNGGWGLEVAKAR